MPRTNTIRDRTSAMTRALVAFMQALVEMYEPIGPPQGPPRGSRGLPSYLKVTAGAIPNPKSEPNSTSPTRALPIAVSPNSVALRSGGGFGDGEGSGRARRIRFGLWLGTTFK